MADEKKYLRAILKQARDSMAPSLAAALSGQAQALVLGGDFYRQSSAAVVLYSPIDNEVGTDLILDDALASGRAVFYPRLDCAGNVLSLGRVQSRGDLILGAYGILEPNAAAPALASRDRCLVIIPGLAFTANGERVGRGGGHFDRLLTELSPHAITVGLAYSFQLLDHLPQSKWDQRLSFVVTESAIYSAPDATGRDGGFRAQGGIPR